jgi:hypothetical protein
MFAAMEQHESISDTASSVVSVRVEAVVVVFWWSGIE